MSETSTQTNDRLYAGFSTSEWVDSHFKDRERMSPAQLAVEFQCTYLTPGTAGKIRNVLDAGCGAGFLAEYLKDLSWKKQYVGFDISFPVLAVARKQIPFGHFFFGDIRSLPLGTDTFDLGYARDVIIHHVSPFEAIAELYRVSRHMLLRIRTAEIPQRFTTYYRKGNMLHQFFSLEETVQFLSALRPAPRRIRYRVHIRHSRRYDSEIFSNPAPFERYFVTDFLISKDGKKTGTSRIANDSDRTLWERMRRRLEKNRSWL